MSVLADWQIKQGQFIDPFVERQEAEGKLSYGLSSYGYDCRLGYKFKVFSPVSCEHVDPKNFNPKTFQDVDLSPLPHVWRKIFLNNRENRYWECGHCLLQGDYEYDLRGENLNTNPCTHRDQPTNYILIPPNSFVLGETIETFNIPRDVLAICLGKSSYARCGIIVNVTPLEPEWRGKVTVEISNTSPLPARIYAGEGIMQVLFLRSDGVSEMLINRLLLELHGGNEEHPLFYQEAQFANHSWYVNASCKTSYADRKGKYMDQKGLTLPFVKSKEDNDGSGTV